MLEQLSDEEYLALQIELSKRPASGTLIQGTGGLRKVRWRTKGTGKSGGVRVIYYWVSEDHQILLLMIYPKSRKDDLSGTEKALLRKLVENWNG